MVTFYSQSSSPDIKKKSFQRNPTWSRHLLTNQNLFSPQVNMISTEFSVEVDGEQFNVRVSPLSSDKSVGSCPDRGSTAQNLSASEEVPEGAMISGIAGLVISIKVKVGDMVEPDAELMVIESMKMMRNYSAPHGGTVKEIRVKENQTVNADDVLMVVI